jgi:uncharacterized protein YodC (DUF2158 family)
MAEFKPGDVVKLKSGGPAMTIAKYGKYSDGEKALCEWFDGKGEVKRDTFADYQLVAVKG